MSCLVVVVVVVVASVVVVVAAGAAADAATSSCNQCNLVASHVRNVVHRSNAKHVSTQTQISHLSLNSKSSRVESLTDFKSDSESDV